MFIGFAAFGREAEACAEYLSKGKQIAGISEMFGVSVDESGLIFRDF